jgi:hypothetical protein
MKTNTVEKLIWVLIYGGLLVLSLSVFVARRTDVIGVLLTLAGAVATVVGVALVWLRSRMNADPPPSAAPDHKET